MEYKFRDKMLNNDKFKETFNNLLSSGRIIDIPSDIWKIISNDKTIININDENITFLDIFEKGYNEGRCYQCSTNLALLLYINDYEVSQVIGKNAYFKGTSGSPSGGHYWLEIKYNGDYYVLDTSLLCMIKKYSSYSLGYNDIKSINAKDMLLHGDYYNIYLKLKEGSKRL